MPLSEFSWNPFYSNSSNNGNHGNKRRLSQEVTEEQQETAIAHKRRCVNNHHCVEEVPLSLPEINHNKESIQNLNAPLPSQNNPLSHCSQDVIAFPSQTVWPYNMSAEGAAGQEVNFNSPPQAQVFVQHPESQLTCTVISHSVGHPTVNHQDDMIMDLNDETYSTAQIDMYNNEDQAFSVMDSDCVPNPNQYNIQTSHNQHGSRSME